MKTYRRFAKIMALTLIFVACDATQKRGVDYEIASPVYIALAEKSLDYLLSFDWDSFAEMLTDSIEYELPDGTKMIGKTALINYWKNCKTNVGIKSMKITNANYLPLDYHSKLKNSDSLGIKVVVDFTNNMMVKNKDVSVKMNFSFHFNQQKLIDRINSNYDQTLFQKTKFWNNKLSFWNILPTRLKYCSLTFLLINYHYHTRLTNFKYLMIKIK